MALFLVQHRHEPERCPARDPQMASMLLKHLSPSNTASYDIKLKGEVVIQGGHTLYLIAEASDPIHVSRFMEPFARAGTVEILPASTCEEVVERGEC
jgi:hypothetical protein